MTGKFHITSHALLNPGGECDLSFVPPMTRRRFSPLQKAAFWLLDKVAPKGSEPKIVFASRDGEVKLTHDLVETFNDSGDVSPWKFSSSVYNAAPGLYSVFAGNRSTYTAIAAGDETIESSLIEAVFEEGGAVWCYAEESDGGFGAAAGIVPRDSGDGGCRAVEFFDGDETALPLDFARLAAFLSGASSEVVGRRISLRWA